MFRYTKLSRSWSLLALMACCLPSPVLFADAAHAQTELHQQARQQLAAHDSAAALNTLRELTRRNPDYAPGWGLLGSVLTARASGVATDFKERSEAEEALRNALDLDPRNPVYLATLGRLMRKQQVRLDARRMLNRAIGQIESGTHDAPAEDLSELWYQRGLFYEDDYLDGHGFHTMPEPPPVLTPDCSNLGAFCMNFTRPSTFNEHFRAAVDLSGDAEDEFQDMVDAFQRALELHPAHSRAFRRLAIHRIDRADYVAAEYLARRFIESAPHEPWGHFILGLAYHRTGRDSLAEAAFDRGIERAPPEVADHYQDVSNLLAESLADAYAGSSEARRRLLERVLWSKSDPLYLSPENEVRVGHLARVAYADIMFEDPAEGVWGSETERGVIYVRYGPPVRIWKIRRDPQLESQGVGTPNVRGGGRWIFWNYGWDLPNFIFEKLTGHRHTSHMLSSVSKNLEEEARAQEPAVFTTDFAIIDFPAQVSRFRGPDDAVVEVDVYSRVPPADLLAGGGAPGVRAPEPDSVTAGFFVFAGAAHARVVNQKVRLPASPDPKPLTYAVALPGGVYDFSLEARANESTAAVRRGQLDLTRFPADSLALSDIVLARTVAPRGEEPAGRRDFAIRPYAEARFGFVDPFSLYWETYGLTANDEGFAHYRVRLTVSDAEGQGVFTRVIGALGDLVSGSDDRQVELIFERTVEATGDRVPDYLELRLADDRPGEYRVQLRIEDLNSDGDEAVRERTFELIE